MTSRTDDRTEGGGYVHWVAGVAALLLLMAVVFALFFLVPKLEAHWANTGTAPPLYGRLLFTMTHYLPGVIMAGLVLVGLAFRRRS